MKNIVILISGRGSNLQAIYAVAQRDKWLENEDINLAAVISNQANAAGIEWARGVGITTEVLAAENFQTREEYDTELIKLVDKYQPDLVVLAGFMRILTAKFVQHFQHRIINIHPSLLPSFKGINTHQRALAAGCRTTGATVHEVSVELDSGKILAQIEVPISATDNASSLANKVLLAEHTIYPAAILQKIKQLSSK